MIVIVQYYLIYTVFSYFMKLQKEFREREENRDKRNRRPMSLGFVRSTQNIQISTDDV